MFLGNKYFKSSEFDSPDLPGSGSQMNLDFIAKLTKARELANIPFIINSGYRSIDYNKRVGGVVNSSHTRGLAADILCIDSNSRHKILHSLIKVGFRRLGIAQGFIHVDNDNEKGNDVIWLYSNKLKL